MAKLHTRDTPDTDGNTFALLMNENELRTVKICVDILDGGDSDATAISSVLKEVKLTPKPKETEEDDSDE